MTAFVDSAGAAAPAWTAPAAPPTTTAADPTMQDEAHSVPKPIVGPMKAAVVAVGVAVGILGVLGFVNSFHRVDTSAQPSFHGLAWSVPIGIDLAILIFSALDIVLAMLDMRLVWLRLIPWALTFVTVRLNVADQPGQPKLTGFDQLAHGVLPSLWALSIEVGAHVVRKRAHLASPKRMDRVRTSRWLLAPVPTLRLWRRMVLWEERSYPSALVRERERVLAKTDLQDRYGVLWRIKAPRRARALYRLGELAPTANLAPVTQPGTPVSAQPTHGDTASQPPASADSPAESPAQEAGESGESRVSQPSSLYVPGTPVFAQTIASLPPVTHRESKRRRVAAASAPARRQASVSARVNTDHDAVAKAWLDSVANGTPLSTRDLADATGVSQSTANRVLNKLRKPATDDDPNSTSGQEVPQS